METTKQIKSVGVIGHFALGGEGADGQIVKTRTVHELLCDVLGEDNVRIVDTRGWTRRPAGLLRECVRLAKASDALVMLPAHNGVRVFAPLLRSLKRRHGCKAVYSVIGGWLPEFIADKPRLARSLRGFDCVLVESDRMRGLLEAQGFSNAAVAYNYKRLPMLDERDLKRPTGRPFPLAVFSRIYAEKGIDDAVWAVREANRRLGRQAYRLDIYGKVLPGYAGHFDELMAGCDEGEVAYRGVAPAGESVFVLNGYLALAFPTRCPGEGVPGTVVDAYSAGIPVIASRWPSCAEMVDEGATGVTYTFGEREALLDVLMDEVLPERLLGMKGACLRKSRGYSYEAGLAKFKRLVEGGFDVRG